MRRLIGVILAVVAGAIIASALWPIPAALQHETPSTARLLDVHGRELAVIASVDARAQFPLPLEKMGTWLPRVTVALEDHRFYSHRGCDWRALAAAIARNLRTGRIVSGASTIDQQLVKLATARRGRHFTSKIFEAIVAEKIAARWSRERVLAEYLNRSSYGNRRLGPEAAARAYFGKSARDLTLAEAVYLAGLPQAPTRLNPWTHPERAARKYRQSLVRLRDLGEITPAQCALLMSAPPVIQHCAMPHLAPHFVDTLVAARPHLRSDVVTTLDLDLQTRAENMLRAHLANLNRYDIAESAVVIVENATGAVRALVGSSDYARAQTNGALQTRSSGSTLKPFAYLKAIDERVLTAATILPDTADAMRDTYADYDPQNYNRRFLGPVRVREALACSLNVPAVVALSRVGARAAFHDLEKWGFRFPRTFDDYGAGFVLGNAEVRLVDLAAAYAGLARSGLAQPAKLIEREHFLLTRIASADACAIVTDILCDNEARARSFGATSPLAFVERVAVKTGTSSGFRDAWTVGFDREHTVAVWAGNLSGAPMRDTLAVRSASPLWAALMHELLQNDHALPAPQTSDTLTRTEICRATGLLPSPQSASLMSEWFLAGTAPTTRAEFAESGHMLLPAEYAGWCATSDNASGAEVRRAAQITSPSPRAHFQIENSLARAQQMIELTSTLGRDAQWFVNDAPQIPRADGRTFWPLAEGEWKIRVRNQSASAETSVRVD
ncbi:MAG: penicillin-binding protein 1C [Verrucomicrobiota bacterium]|nr:penicillin-binding protein 1C [Verrucomicrobiota bacterium]